MVITDERYTLHNADCLDTMAAMEPESVDAIVQDPPAGIAFMGRSWDNLKKYKAQTERGAEVSKLLDQLGLERWAAGFVTFLTEVFVAELRVAKPGAHSLTWALPRTADLTTLALRLAGWEIRDSIVHLFACLTDDAEILTEHGWTRRQNLATSDLALCYDVDRGTYQWQRIERRIDFPHIGDAYRVRGEGVDHTVTSDHRCVDGRRFITAEQAARQPSIRVPVPESLHGLRLHVAGDESLPSTEGADLRADMRGQVERDEAQGDTHNPASALSDLRSALLAQEPNPEPTALLAPLLRYLAEHGHEHAGSHADDLAGWTSRSDAGVDSPCGGQDAGPEQPGMEGWRGPAQSCRAQADGSAGPLSAGATIDGASERLRAATPTRGSAGDRTRADEDGSGAPRGPRPDQQSSEQPDAVRDESGSQVVRSTRLADATVERVQYDGRMWCVTVPTGAFVARTTAGAFVTGNSGFPKSLDVGKAIDKQAGARREVIGNKRVSRDMERHGETGDMAISSKPVHGCDIDITAPATEAAKQWDGWHTALSPGHEQWILARKPLAGTVVATVLAHGTGAINVGATRTPTAPGDVSGFSKTGSKTFAAGKAISGAGAPLDPKPDNAAGRWPKNAILSCSLACEAGRHSPGCPVGELDRQSGHQVSGVAVNRNLSNEYNSPTVYSRAVSKRGEDVGFGDAGGASRFFPRFGYHPKASDRSVPGRADLTNKHACHKNPKMMSWLVRLITPPEGVVLDPFMGSGTTGVAAMREGVRFVGIEREQEHFDVAHARILSPDQPKKKRAKK